MKTAGSAGGRPRDAGATAKVLAVTQRLLDERGAAALRIDDVARASGVAKTTIYRRWPSLTALIVAAMEVALGPRPLPDTGDPEADLMALLEVVFDSVARAPFARALPLISVELLQQPELARQYRTRVIDPARDHGIRLVRAGIAQGLFRAGTDPALVVDTVIAPLIYRPVVLHEQVSPAQARAIAELVLRSVRAGSLERTRPVIAPGGDVPGP
ncbi:TetR/AcrR family transcriptional regulator [Nucisporomicrobium flavum]|jgi:AcrR family transcriptional regulator|uniref:TetR/AcrR family transcriptional regulator n=1 Tax=Nucisporomicrobium flavum TaxID=2785915 RepID=UPI0018F7076E|nr:TetR/AcrR family transcriptional regulator [Nucisporomicrobium flavum]